MEASSDWSLQEKLYLAHAVYQQQTTSPSWPQVSKFMIVPFKNGLEPQAPEILSTLQRKFSPSRCASKYIELLESLPSRRDRSGVMNKVSKDSPLVTIIKQLNDQYEKYLGKMAKRLLSSSRPRDDPPLLQKELQGVSMDTKFVDLPADVQDRLLEELHKPPFDHDVNIKQLIANIKAYHQNQVEQAKQAKPGRILREAPSGLSKHQNRTLLNALNAALKTLANEQFSEIFRYPVTEAEAPGYGDLVKHRMDLSNIKKMIQQRRVSNGIEFKRNLLLMIANAMVFNPPKSFFYKDAQSLKARIIEETQKIFDLEDSFISENQSIEHFPIRNEKIHSPGHKK